MLNHLEEGYTLRLTRSGIVFHLDKDGYENEKENEVTYHYLGLDRVKSLISVIHETDKTQKQAEPDPAYVTTRGTFTHRPLKLTNRILNPTPISVGESPSASEKGDDISNQKSMIEVVDENKNKDQVPGGNDHVVYDVLLGSKHQSPQFGILGRTSGQKVGLDLNATKSRLVSLAFRAVVRVIP